MYYFSMDNKKKLGKRIKELRKQKCITQEKLAELIGMEQNTISVIESGRNFPTLSTLEKIATIFEVELCDFFNYDYFEDIEQIKEFTNTKLEKMTETQLRQTYKYIKNII